MRICIQNATYTCIYAKWYTFVCLLSLMSLAFSTSAAKKPICKMLYWFRYFRSTRSNSRCQRKTAMQRHSGFDRCPVRPFYSLTIRQLNLQFNWRFYENVKSIKIGNDMTTRARWSRGMCERLKMCRFHFSRVAFVRIETQTGATHTRILQFERHLSAEHWKVQQTLDEAESILQRNS